MIAAEIGTEGSESANQADSASTNWMRDFSKSILNIQSEHRESYYSKPNQINEDCNDDGEEKPWMGQSL